ncbi:MAG: hypothetical protein ACRCX2_02910 [Paraclostridium sp.]
MEGIIVTIFSALISSFLLHIFNQKRGIFVSIQNYLRNLSRTNRGILNFVGYLLAILISVFFRISFDINTVMWCAILGFLMAIIDTCFGDNIIGKRIMKNK